MVYNLCRSCLRMITTSAVDDDELSINSWSSDQISVMDLLAMAPSWPLINPKPIGMAFPDSDLKAPFLWLSGRKTVAWRVWAGILLVISMHVHRVRCSITSEADLCSIMCLIIDPVIIRSPACVHKACKCLPNSESSSSNTGSSCCTYWPSNKCTGNGSSSNTAKSSSRCFYSLVLKAELLCQLPSSKLASHTGYTDSEWSHHL